MTRPDVDAEAAYWFVAISAEPCRLETEELVQFGEWCSDPENCAAFDALEKTYTLVMQSLNGTTH